MQLSRLHLLLPTFGVFPFIACLALSFLGVTDLAVLINPLYIANTYGLTIISFMAGTHWGFYLYKASRIRFLISSNIITIAAWVAFLLYPPQLTALILAFCFIAVLASDASLAREQHLNLRYMKVRYVMTSIVVICLVGVAI